VLKNVEEISQAYNLFEAIYTQMHLAMMINFVIINVYNLLNSHTNIFVCTGLNDKAIMQILRDCFHNNFVPITNINFHNNNTDSDTQILCFISKCSQLNIYFITPLFRI